MSQLTKQFAAETHDVAMYRKSGSDYHTLKYVSWLEAKVENLQQTTNSSSPKLPEFTMVYDQVKAWYDSAPSFAMPSPADIAKVTYDIIAGNFGH